MSAHADALRRAFDASFAEPLQTSDEALHEAIAIRAGDRQLAIRVPELAGIEVCRRFVPLPSGAPGLLGLVGVRGQLVAAYDIAVLLGCRAPSPDGAGPALRWMLLCKGVPGLGLAVDHIEGYLRFFGAEVRADERAGAGDPVREALQQGGAVRGLVDLPSLAAAVLRLARGGHEPSKASP